MRGGPVTIARMIAWRAWQWKHKPQCDYCKKPIQKGRATIDHIVPPKHPKAINGARHAIGNLALSCQRCNVHKGSRTPREAGMRITYRATPPECVAEMCRAGEAAKAKKNLRWAENRGLL